MKLDRYDEVAGPADPGADLTLGVLHAPYQRVLDAMSRDGVRLMIAGHTHGGQLRVPGYGALVTNCDLDRYRASGLSRWWPGAGFDPARPCAGACPGGLAARLAPGSAPRRTRPCASPARRRRPC